MNTLEELVDCHDGVVSVPVLAEYFGVSEAYVREFANANAVARAGNSFAFTLERVQELAEDLEAEGEEDDDDDDEADDEHECD